jgi:hypothetical protein
MAGKPYELWGGHGRSAKESGMGRRVLLLSIIVVLSMLLSVGCSPRHPPHTPQLFGVEGGAPAFFTGP